MLLVDHAVDCTSNAYVSMQVYASVMIAVLPVGFGLAALVGLWQLRHILREANEADMDEHPRLATSPLRPLFGSYKPSVAAWYDVLDMGRRALHICPLTDREIVYAYNTLDARTVTWCETSRL